MKKQTLYTVASIMFVLCTTLLIFLGFFVLTPTKTHMIGVCTLSFIGYSAAYEYHLLSQSRSDGEYSLHTIGIIALVIIMMAA